MDSAPGDAGEASAAHPGAPQDGLSRAGGSLVAGRLGTASQRVCHRSPGEGARPVRSQHRRARGRRAWARRQSLGAAVGAADVRDLGADVSRWRKALVARAAAATGGVSGMRILWIKTELLHPVD